MRRLFLTFFLFVLLGFIVALVFRDHQGYVLIAFNGWQIETSLLFACAALLVGLWLLVTVWRLIVAGVLLPRAVRRRLARRRARKARDSLYNGLQRLAEGHWLGAEKELRRLAEQNEAPGLNYLYAARAAQQRGHIVDRDRYLELAARKPGVSELAVLLTRAELQIAQGQSREALASLARLHRMERHHPLILKLYAEQALASGEYKQLRALLPALYKHSNLPKERVDDYAMAVWHDELIDNSRDSASLVAAWRRVPRQLRANPQMAMRYVSCLCSVNADDEAAAVIRETLKQTWSAPLVLAFGNLGTINQATQLSTVEGWLRQYGDQPELLLVAGRLCLRNRLWGRARSYFEASQKHQSRPEALLELGRLFEEINEKEEARVAYRQGLELRSKP